MTRAQEIQVRMSEKRQKLNELLGVETRSTEQQAELERLRAEIQKLEPELREALAAEPDPETRSVTGDPETRGLMSRVSLARMVHGAIEQRSVDGAERELQQEFSLAGNEVPIELLRVPETRAVTTAPTDVGATEAPTVMPVFASGAGAFLGIERPVVDAGDAVYPVLGVAPTQARGPHTDSTDHAELDGTLVSNLLAPERLSAGFLYRRTDAMRYPNMDASLRTAINGALEEKLDYEALAGDSGLFAGANLAANAAAAVTTWERYISDFCFSRVDGRFARRAGDLRILMGSATYAHAGGAYRANETDETALDRLMAKTGGVEVSAHVPAVAANKQNALIRLGMRRDMVQPTWRNVAFVLDELTGAKAGEVRVTAIMGMNTKILRAAGFHKQETQHA